MGKYKFNFMPSVSYLQQAEIFETIRGAETQTGTYQKSYLGEGGLTIRVRKMEDGKRGIDLTIEELERIVPLFNISSKDGDPIENADPKKPESEFWNDPSVKFYFPYQGIVLDEDRAMEKFWIAVAKKDERFYFEDGEAPASMSKVKFLVKLISDKQEPVLKEDTKKTFSLFQKIIGLSLSKKKILLEAFPVYSGENFDEYSTDELNSMILKLVDDNTLRTEKGDSVETIIDSIASIDELGEEIRKNIELAKSAQIVTMKGKEYVFEGRDLGKTIKAVIDYLKSDIGKPIYAKILEKMIEANGSEGDPI